MAVSKKPYTDIEWMRFHYVQKRMGLKQIKDILKEKYNVDVTVQTLYNWAEKFDLLKFRGKGRTLRAKTTGMQKKKKSAMQLRIEARRREMQKRNKMNKAVRRRPH